LEETITSPLGGSINEILNSFEKFLNTPSTRHRRVPLLFSQINIRSIRRAGGLLRDEIYWNMGKTNINSQLHFVPGGLDRGSIKKILKIKPQFRQIQFKRMTLNLWEFEIS
jgi:hypothetical protein